MMTAIQFGAWSASKAQTVQLESGPTGTGRKHRPCSLNLVPLARRAVGHRFAPVPPVCSASSWGLRRFSSAPPVRVSFFLFFLSVIASRAASPLATGSARPARSELDGTVAPLSGVPVLLVSIAPCALLGDSPSLTQTMARISAANSAQWAKT
jgi:hypothetical protein